MYVEGTSEKFVMGWDGHTEQRGYLGKETPLGDSGCVVHYLLR